jgi:hypothetical protein
MSTVANSQPGVKAGRTVRVAVRPTDVNPSAIIVVREPKHSDHYIVTPIPADCGTAYKVVKFLELDEPSYHVLLADDGRHSCECKGFLRWNRCKHVSGLLALRQAGQL